MLLLCSNQFCLAEHFLRLWGLCVCEKNELATLLINEEETGLGARCGARLLFLKYVPNGHQLHLVAQELNAGFVFRLKDSLQVLSQCC